jgi:hypothetical protein
MKSDQRKAYSFQLLSLYCLEENAGPRSRVYNNTA